VDIRITAQTADEGDELKPFVKRLRNRLSKYIYSESDLTLSEIVGQLLLEKKLTLSVAESFTGGLICDLLTNRPGSSEYFLGGAITYSNESKIHLLNVRPQTIEHHGAVSEQTALEMAEGVQRSFQSDCALSSTGIAGPTGATAQKPVGLCYLAAKYGTETEVRKFTFGKDRRMNKERGASAAFELLRRILTKV
jgi:nicotinamide-nucleotide amidase